MPENKQLIYEIADIIDQYCGPCPIKKQIRKEHGVSNEQRYCNEICKTGKLLREKGKILDKMDRVYLAKDLTPERYEALKAVGYFDKEIAAMHGIALSSLSRRKKYWGIYAPEEMTQEIYEGMRARGYTDKEICKAKKVGHMTLIKKKKEWGQKDEQKTG
jgi:hypothetical protein